MLKAVNPGPSAHARAYHCHESTTVDATARPMTTSSEATADPIKLEVDQYFACGNEPFQRDVLAVWLDIGKRFPTLAKIAQDILSVCASSTASETQFSKARKVANPWRNSLGEKSMQATLCLKSWYLMPELRDVELLGE